MLDQIVEYIGTTKFRFSAIICIIISIILLCEKSNIISDIIDKNVKINSNKLPMVVEKNKTLGKKMLNSCRDGLIKGGVTGSITGGFIGAVTGGAIFAIANPILLYINES